MCAALHYDFLYASPIGELGGCIRHHCLTRLEWLDGGGPRLAKSSDEHVKEIIITALSDYFEMGVMRREIPLLLSSGTAFQQAVWRTLGTIPAGSTQTYGDIAKRLQTSARAVGQACRGNIIPLFIPCHRVVAKHAIGGFMGGYRHVERKRWLLRHEGIL